MNWKALLAGALGCLVGLVCPACTTEGSDFSGGTTPPPSTFTVTLEQPAPGQLTRDGDSVDTIDVEGFDGGGNRTFGPLRLPFGALMPVAGIPVGTTRLQVDYLRNGGFMLFRADVGVRGIEETVVPLLQLVELNDSNFQIVNTGAGFSIQRTVTGADPSDGLARSEHQARGLDANFRFKGVCYSPAPINFSNKEAPAVGDLFWDSFKAGPDDIFGWAVLYLNFYDPNTGQSRADLDKIRALGANSIRLYSALSYHLGTNGEFVDQSTAHRFAHEAFLDACYDHDSARGLAVLVDIPMPDVCFRYTLKEALDQPADQRAQVKAQRALQVAWWEANFRATVEDLSKHPAVVGFNIMNEQDGADWSHPNQGQGPDNDETRYFYAQSKKYADLVKQVDPGKLCGWGFHDSPDLVIFGKAFPSAGPKYLEQLSSFDYWGINSYQTINFDSVVGPGFRGSYNDLPPSMKKPVLLTELGWPCTGHDQGQLVDTEQTQQNTAAVVARMYPQVYQHPQLLGAFYFEFADEWWKQPGGQDFAWNPGNPEPAFPNGFWDEEGFGLYSVKRQGGRPDNDLNFITFGPNPTAPFGSKGPKLPYDAAIPRTPVIDALKKAYTSQS